MKKWITISLILSLLSVVLMPLPVVASDTASMSASGVITGISEPVEFTTGNGGNIKVISRDIYGSFTTVNILDDDGIPDDEDILGDFVMNYKANIELATQSGNFSGTLTSGIYMFRVNGYIQPVQLVPVPSSPGAFTGISTSTGQWTLKGDDNSHGTFTATVYFVPTPDGHVAYVLPGSTFSMIGVWAE